MNTAVYKHLLSTYGRRPGVWFGLVAELVRTILGRVVLAIIMAQIAANLAGGNLEAARRYTLYLLITMVAGTLIAAAGELVSVRSENRLYAQLSASYFRKLTAKDMSFYRDNQAGYLVSLFRQYLDSILVLVRLFRTDVIRAGVSLILPALVLFSVSRPLGVAVIIVVIVQLVYIVWSSARVNEYRVRAHELYRLVTGEVADVITNIVAFKSSGAERQAEQHITKLAKQEADLFWLRRKTVVTLDFPRDIITAAGVAAAFLIIIMSTPGQARSVGLTVLTVTYIFQIIRSVNDLPSLLTQHDDLITKAYPTLAYLGGTHEEIADPPRPKPLEIKHGEIELDNISFAYDAGGGRRVPVFTDLSIHIKDGEQVGIVGLSGAGKSTLASLFMRFDDVDSGAIRIDGIDIRDVRQSDLRRQIAYVPQEPLLFHRSIKENIAYFDDHATEADISQAAVAAHARSFIDRLPDGYDSMVGERGVKLSGGQKQRIVIARAILKNAPIMIFDEATSALDSESEKIIQRALPEIIGKHTAIVIAHRLSTIAGLDRILVMHEGQIVEEGTHDELLAMHGRYWSLWAKQVGNPADTQRATQRLKKA